MARGFSTGWKDWLRPELISSRAAPASPIDAPVRHRDHGGNHLVMAPLERQIGRHQSAESPKGVIQGLRDQGMRSHDSSRTILSRMNRNPVLCGIDLLLFFQRLAQTFVRLGKRNRLYPGHNCVCSKGVLRLERKRYTGHASATVPKPARARTGLSRKRRTSRTASSSRKKIGVTG